MDISVNFFKICGIALICVILLSLLKKSFGGMDTVVRAGGAIVVFSLLVSGLAESLGAVREMISSVAESSAYLNSSFSLMIKALGVAVFAKLCADICRDCGESSLASGIEGAGRIAIISLCIPVIGELMRLALKILEMGE
jgi:stage III sporulation protein AD